MPPGDLLRDPLYLRLFGSILTSSFGNQVMMLALPLTAAVLLQATPTQMGLLTAMELLPFMLFSLPGGVWLDRVRKLEEDRAHFHRRQRESVADSEMKQRWLRNQDDQRTNDVASRLRLAAAAAPGAGCSPSRPGG